MEHHKCKLYKGNGLFDGNAECLFEIKMHFNTIWGEGEILSKKSLFRDFVHGSNEYMMKLDDGRKGKIIVANITSDDPTRGNFRTTGPLE